MNKVVVCREEYELSLNIRKRKFMSIFKNAHSGKTLTVNDRNKDKFNKFTYPVTVV